MIRRTLHRRIAAAFAVAAALASAAPTTAVAQGAARTFVGTPFTWADAANTRGAAIVVADVFPVTALTVRVGLRDAISADTRLTLHWTPLGGSQGINFTLLPQLDDMSRPRAFDGVYAFTSLPGGPTFPATQDGDVAPGEYADFWLHNYFSNPGRPSAAGTFELVVTDYVRGNGGGEVTSLALEFNGAASTVPEPTTALLLAPALAAGALVARRRRA